MFVPNYFGIEKKKKNIYIYIYIYIYMVLWYDFKNKKIG